MMAIKLIRCQFAYYSTCGFASLVTSLPERLGMTLWLCHLIHIYKCHTYIQHTVSCTHQLQVGISVHGGMCDTLL